MKESIYDNIKEPPKNGKEVLEKQKELGNIIIPELGKWVKEAKEQGLKLGLTKEEVKKVIKITFSILGKLTKQ